MFIDQSAIFITDIKTSALLKSCLAYIYYLSIIFNIWNLLFFLDVQHLVVKERDMSTVTEVLTEGKVKVFLKYKYGCHADIFEMVSPFIVHFQIY